MSTRQYITGLPCTEPRCNGPHGVLPAHSRANSGRPRTLASVPAIAQLGVSAVRKAERPLVHAGTPSLRGPARPFDGPLVSPLRQPSDIPLSGG